MPQLLGQRLCAGLGKSSARVKDLGKSSALVAGLLSMVALGRHRCLAKRMVGSRQEGVGKNGTDGVQQDKPKNEERASEVSATLFFHVHVAAQN